jgi:hypothetical protein
VDTVDPGGRLTDAELGELARLLARYAANDLDQWENWRIETSHGPVYLLLTRMVMPGWPEEGAFTTVWPLPPHLAGDQSRRWTVWRQDDNGHRCVVSRHDSRAEADSVAATMEARGHRQTYWVAESE